MKILFVIHSDFEIPSFISSWAKEKKIELDVRRPFKGEVLPHTSEFDWLILFGGTQCLLELDRHPFLLDEVRLVEKAIATNKNVLGICLGAQIIGKAHVCPTEESPHEEVGFSPVRLTQGGEKDLLLKGLPHTFSAAHWHKYMPGLSKTAEILAASEGCPRQIIRYSSKAYGIQCHLETTQQQLKTALHLFGQNHGTGHFIQSNEQFLQGNFSEINNHMILILDNLLSQNPIH